MVSRSVLLSFFLALPVYIYSQQVIVNSNGDKIIMYPDGSWRTFEAKDSALLNQTLQKTEPFLDTELGAQSIHFQNKAEAQNFLIRQGLNLKSKITELVRDVQDNFRNATNAQFKAGQMLRNAEANKGLIDPRRLTSLAAAYDLSVKNLRTAKLNQKAAKKLEGEILALSDNPEKIKKKKLDQLIAKYNLFLSNYSRDVSADSVTEVSSKPNSPDKLKSSSGKQDKYPPNNTAPLPAPSNPKKTKPVAYPPASKTYARQPYDCKISLDTVDAESKRHQVQVTPSIIFTHTDPDLRPYFKNKDLITCKGSLMKIGPYVYFNIEFQIASSHSQTNFGALQKESLLRLKLMNGEYISLYNIKSDRGHLDPYTGHTIFSGQYSLGRDEIKKLRASELDKIRVLWATGFEDYDVYHIDFFLNQLRCLETH